MAVVWYIRGECPGLGFWRGVPAMVMRLGGLNCECFRRSHLVLLVNPSGTASKIFLRSSKIP